MATANPEYTWLPEMVWRYGDEQREWRPVSVGTTKNHEEAYKSLFLLWAVGESNPRPTD
ncbi:MAG: hypothetical protein ACREXR_04840 [Gammaproteobacteria bacterium]